jgi:hypothetical protein
VKNVLCLIAVSIVLFGCTVSTTNPLAPQAPGAVEPQAETAVPEAQEPPLTLSETMQLCKKMHASPELGIGCDVRYVEGKPAMVVVFPHAAAMRALWTGKTKYIAASFCFAAVTANQEAFVFLGIQDTHQARRYSCAMQEWSKWFEYGSKGIKRH